MTPGKNVVNEQLLASSLLIEFVVNFDFPSSSQNFSSFITVIFVNIMKDVGSSKTGSSHIMDRCCRMYARGPSLKWASVAI